MPYKDKDSPEARASARKRSLAYYHKNREARLLYYQAHKEERRAYNKAYAAAHKERYQTIGIAWRQQNKGKLQEQAKARQVALKTAAFAAYGGAQCACCGESHIEFLSVDHINGGGSLHRQAIRTAPAGHRAGSIYKWLKDNEYPLGFRVLCMNCNCAIGWHGFCPHNQPA